VRTGTKLGAYAGGLVAIFAAMFGLGAVTGSPVATPETHDDHTDSHEAGTGHASNPLPTGLQVTDGGYTLGQITAPDEAGVPGSLSFAILGPDGAPVTEFVEDHGEELHLIVVNRDTTGYHHVHPDLAADGTWSIEWTWEAAGSYRVFADFVPADVADGLTLGRDVNVAGDYEPPSTPSPSTVATVDDYSVEVDGELTTGESSELTVTITRDGRPVTDLEPYLGAYGHLVALRAGDLAYLHVHPEGAPGDGVTAPGPSVAFGVEVPSAGTYRLYLDFQHDGVVRTVDFTVDAGRADERTEERQ
jgi:hypothetical protein